MANKPDTRFEEYEDTDARKPPRTSIGTPKGTPSLSSQTPQTKWALAFVVVVVLVAVAAFYQ